MSLALSPALAPFPYAALALALAAGRQVDWVQEAKVRSMTLRLGERLCARLGARLDARLGSTTMRATVQRMPARLRIVC